MKKLFILFLILAVGLSIFVLAEEVKVENPEIKYKPLKEKGKEVEVENLEVKYKPLKLELKLPKLSEKQLGEFKKLDDFIREEVAEHPGASYFFLTPSNHASQQGFVDQNQNNVLTINSNGFKMNWLVATDTMVISAQRLGLLAQVNPLADVKNIATGTRVRVFGNWDGNNLIAKRIVVLEAVPKRVVQPEVNELINNIKELFEKSGIQIDWAPVLQQLQERFPQLQQR
ncbi:MAG: hypothetical protein C4348_01895 [Patescibacteria group bacterium]